MDPKRRKLSGGPSNGIPAIAPEAQGLQQEMNSFDPSSAAVFCEVQLDEVADVMEPLDLSGKPNSQGTSGSNSGGAREQSGANSGNGNGNSIGQLQMLESVLRVNVELCEKLGQGKRRYDMIKHQNSQYSWDERRALLIAVAYTAGLAYQERRSYPALAQEMRSALFWSNPLPYLDNAKSLHELFGELLPTNTLRCRDPESLKLKWNRMLPLLTAKGYEVLDKYQVELTPEQVNLVMLAEECKKLKNKRKKSSAQPPSSIPLESGSGAGNPFVPLSLD